MRLDITDDGVGMPPHVQPRIFDPFDTTNITGRRLGLASLLGIVRSHDGSLTVRSEAGLGSTFCVYLPAVAGAPVEPVAAPAPTPTPTAAPTASGTVLVADDEDSVRSLLAAILKRLGYTVVAVETGDEALRRFTAEPDRFQLALLDITMPGIDGLSALRRMREVRPALPCVILSGHSEQDAAGHFGGTGHTTFLQKPFEIADLMQALARVKPTA